MSDSEDFYKNGVPHPSAATRTISLPISHLSLPEMPRSFPGLEEAPQIKRGLILLQDFSYTQLRYMARFKEDFCEAQNDEALETFWPRFYRAWNDRFPINSDGHLCSRDLTQHCMLAIQPVSGRSANLFLPTPAEAIFLQLQVLRTKLTELCGIPDTGDFTHPEPHKDRVCRFILAKVFLV